MSEGREKEISPNSASYRKIKGLYAEAWRDKIFHRDGEKCLVCGNTTNLELAHVTAALAFVRALGLEEGMKASYREDNLITLCNACHQIAHRQIDSPYEPKIASKREEQKKIVETGGTAKDYLKLQDEIHQLYETARTDGANRRKKVEALVEQIKLDRGWRNASHFKSQLMLPEGFIPAHGIPRGYTWIQRYKDGVCLMKATTCRPPVERCPVCGLPFCQYHKVFHPKYPQTW